MNLIAPESCNEVLNIFIWKISHMTAVYHYRIGLSVFNVVQTIERYHSSIDTQLLYVWMNLWIIDILSLGNRVESKVI